MISIYLQDTFDGDDNYTSKDGPLAQATALSPLPLNMRCDSVHIYISMPILSSNSVSMANQDHDGARAGSRLGLNKVGTSYIAQIFDVLIGDYLNPATSSQHRHILPLDPRSARIHSTLSTVALMGLVTRPPYGRPAKGNLYKFEWNVPSRNSNRQLAALWPSIVLC
jgi:hypothetical protein